MPAGDAEDRKRYERYESLCKRAAALEEKAITAPTERERRAAAEGAQLLRAQAFNLFA